MILGNSSFRVGGSKFCVKAYVALLRATFSGIVRILTPPPPNCLRWLIWASSRVRLHLNIRLHIKNTIAVAV